MISLTPRARTARAISWLKLFTEFALFPLCKTAGAYRPFYRPEQACAWLAASAGQLIGHALDLAQRGDRHDSAKVLQGFGCAGVLEIVEDDAGGTYRAVYTVKFEEAMFVLHCFQKKSKSGISTPKQEMDLVRARLHSAQLLIEELRHEKTHC